MTRMVWYLKRHISSLFGFNLPCCYIRHRRQSLLEHGYLVMDFIEGKGIKMLSETWGEFQNCPSRRASLLRDLSRIILSLSQSPLLRIGSWTLDSSGILQLTNRPLTSRIQLLENERIVTNIDRNLTYSVADDITLISCLATIVGFSISQTP